MSKMGISVLSAYRGGCNFEAVGLSRSVVAEYFPGMISRISGIGIFGIEKKIKELHKKAFQKNVSILPIGGIYKYRKNGENHQYQGNLIHTLQSCSKLIILMKLIKNMQKVFIIYHNKFKRSFRFFKN